MKELISAERIESRIFQVRGKKVMLDSDLALLYDVETKVLIQAVKRNKSRFPEDFMFQLTKEEFISLRSQFVTSNRGGRRYLPYAFIVFDALKKLLEPIPVKEKKIIGFRAYDNDKND